jgi:predicted O-methyltransferase YrrM
LRPRIGRAWRRFRIAGRRFHLAFGKGLLTLDTSWRRRSASFVSVVPTVDQPAYPRVDLAAGDPITEILGAPEFPTCAAFFAGRPAFERALVSAETQALLFALIRNLKAECVIEIGTYRAATTEALCRAVCANGGGAVHTVDPFRHREVSSTLRQWPLALRDCLQTHETSSSDFFAMALREGMRADLVFVDGNHDYEFALFDIECAAHLLRPGGFLAIDNIGQAGPFFAVRDFLERHPGWRECGPAGDKYRPGFAFDPHRTRIVNTDIAVLQSPPFLLLGERPVTPGDHVWHLQKLSGVALDVAIPGTGTVYAQAVIRVFGSPPTERTVESHLDCRDVSGIVELPLAWEFAPEELRYLRQVELWLTWRGEQPLRVRSEPHLF